MDQAVVEIATRMRRALEQGCLQAASFADFPRGSCGDTCELLGELLREHGLGDWTFRGGVSADFTHTHAWLERGGLLVDITADQFPEVDERVIVTRERTWHCARFPTMTGGHTAGLSHWDGPSKEAIERDYQVLKERIARG